MKYLLMIIMFASCIIISSLFNKSKRDRGCVLSAIKDSTKTCEISLYFENLSSGSSKYLISMRKYLSKLIQGKSTVVEAHDEIIKSMPNIFNKSNDSAFLMKYLNAVIDSADKKMRESISLRCEKLIMQNKDEIKTNLYIAIAIAVILVILAI